MSEDFRKKCKCSKPISINDIDVLFGTNENGEEYTEVYFCCSVCEIEVEFYGWGEFENIIDEVFEELNKNN